MSWKWVLARVESPVAPENWKTPTATMAIAATAVAPRCRPGKPRENWYSTRTRTSAGITATSAARVSLASNANMQAVAAAPATNRQRSRSVSVIVKQNGTASAVQPPSSCRLVSDPTSPSSPSSVFV